jgi:hypothetical protein
MIRSSRLFCFAILFIFTVTAESGNARYRDTVEKSFTVKPGGTLHVRTDRGDIEITTHSANQVDVVIERRVRTSDREEAQDILRDVEITMEQDGNDVTVEVNYPGEESWGFWRRRLRPWWRIRVKVPKTYNAQLKTSGGDISVQQLDGELKCTTSGGDLELVEITGPIRARTSGGDIYVESCTKDVDVVTSGGDVEIHNVEGSVEATTSGGDITVTRVRGEVRVRTSGGDIEVINAGKTVEARTSGGDIRASFKKQPDTECHLITTGGNIYVYMAENLRFDIEASTTSGLIKSELPLTIQGEISRRRIDGKINGGGPVLVVRTSGGNIYLKKISR